MNIEYLKSVPSDIWQEIYKFSTPQEVLQFALSSIANYEKVMNDMEKYYTQQCAKLTNGWQGSLCLASKNKKCTSYCINRKNIVPFVLSLPSLVGQTLLCRTKTDSKEFKTVVHQIKLLWGISEIETTKDKKWESVFPPIMDLFSTTKKAEERILWMWDLSPYIWLEIVVTKMAGLPLQSGEYEFILNGMSLGSDWAIEPFEGGLFFTFRKLLVTQKQRGSLKNFPVESIQEPESYQSPYIPPATSSPILLLPPREESISSQTFPSPFHYRGMEEAKVPESFKKRSSLLRKRLRNAKSDAERERLRRKVKLQLLQQSP